MRNLMRKWNRVLLCVLVSCMLLGTAVVQAANPCALRVTIRNDADEPISGINVDLYQVAVTKNGVTTLNERFAGLSLSADQLLADSGADNANIVYQYVFAQEVEYTAKHTTNANGNAEFNNLEQGIYLVLDEGGQKVAFQPYLVVLPMTVDGQVSYYVASSPKTSETDTKSFLVVMLWEDNMNAAGKRPRSVEVTLLRDDIPVRKVTLSADNSWQHQFYQLPTGGEYSVKIDPISQYSTSYDLRGDSCIILNKYTGGGGGGGGGTNPDPPTPPTPEKGHVSVYKIWDDNSDAAGTRPEQVTVQLIRAGTVEKTAALSSANSWSYTFYELDPLASYTVREVSVPGYTPDYRGNAATGITITNRSDTKPEPPDQPINPDPPGPVEPVPETIDIPVVVVWRGDENHPQARPEQVTVHLISSGNIVSTLDLTAADGWQGVFADIPADLAYSIWQLSVDGYSTAYEGSASQGFTVINTYRSQTPSDPPAPPQPPDSPPYEPSVPVKPSQPTIPQTGVQLWPLWLLLVAGVLLIALGLADLYLGRKKS
ncbi:MAG: Cna B-type domain-containing protein [Oscillospiraceae bacterium]|nr:Cna B-type domain-containing protein [Oscillospiraceae bacterium]